VGNWPQKYQKFPLFGKGLPPVGKPLDRFLKVLDFISDVNKDWTCKDKDQAYKDQDKD